MPVVPVRLSLPDDLLSRVRASVEAGSTPSVSAAAVDALSAWLADREGRHPLDLSWPDYLDALRRPRVSRHGDVELMGEGSYVEELRFAEGAFRDHGAFDQMPELVRERVAGFGESNGYVGRMAAARHFKPVVKDRPSSIAKHLDRIPLGGKVDWTLVKGVLDDLRAIKGLGLGSATRLLSVKRPDVFFPVNGANLEEAKRRFGRLRYQMGEGTDDYLRILKLVHSFRWCQEPRPSGEGAAAVLWPYRVALLDVLLYAPDGPDDA